MSVTIDDVRHVARLARLGIGEERASKLVVELNAILGHMAVLAKVRTVDVEPASGVGAGGMPLRDDGGDQYPLSVAPHGFAPAMRDGFLLVPRLASHEDVEEGA